VLVLLRVLRELKRRGSTVVLVSTTSTCSRRATT